MRILSLSVFLGLCVLCVAHALYYYPQLPDTVASHFGMGGQPDDWSSKATILAVYLVLVAVLALMFLGFSFGLAHLPVSLLNVPHKEYWLSPERRQETYAFLSSYFLWFASATLLLVFDMMQQTFQVNLGKADALPHPLLSLGLYIGFALLWCVGLFMRFLKRGAAQSDKPSNDA
jgi:uncharacterized membrane protein